MRFLFSSAFAVLFLGYCFLSVEERYRAPEGDAPAAAVTDVPPPAARPLGADGLPTGVIRLYSPTGPQVFVGPMLTGAQQTKFLAANGVARVIRLNLERAALRQQDTTAQRRAIRPATLHAFNVDAAPKGQLNEVALVEIARLIATSPGPVYVHCQHGVHRAKLVGGLYYARRGYRSHTIYDLLGWWPVVRNPKYEKYVARVRVATTDFSRKPTS